MRFVLKGLAYIVAISGYLVLFVIAVLILSLIGVIGYQEISKIGAAEWVWNCLKVIMVLGGLAFLFGLWVAACNYVGWGDK